MRRTCMLFFQPQYYLLTIGLIRLASQDKSHRQLAVSGVFRDQVKAELMTVGNQLTRLGKDPRPQGTGLNLVAYRASLIQGHSQLSRSDHRAGSAQNIHVHSRDITLSLL